MNLSLTHATRELKEVFDNNGSPIAETGRKGIAPLFKQWRVVAGARGRPADGADDGGSARAR